EKLGVYTSCVGAALWAGFKKLSDQDQTRYKEIYQEHINLSGPQKKMKVSVTDKNPRPELKTLQKKLIETNELMDQLNNKMRTLQTPEEQQTEQQKYQAVIDKFNELTNKQIEANNKRIKKLEAEVKTGKEKIRAIKEKEIRELKEATRIAETKAKVSRHFLSAQSAHEGTFENKQLELWGDDFELDQDQNKYNLDKQLKGYVKDFKGLRLTYWQEKFVTACYCVIEKQQAHAKNPFILLESWADLYKEVLEKKDGGYSGKEREFLIQGGKELQTQLQQMAFYKTITKEKGKKAKKIRKYFVTEGPLITNIGYYGETAETKNVLQDIKNKGKMAISFNLIIFEGLVDRWRLIPKNLTREIKEACPEITRAKITAERFIKWLHTHGIGKIKIKRNRTELIKALDLEKSYKKNKDRTIKKLLECYDIAKKTGYLTDYKLNQKGTIKLLDVFYLNQDKFEHLKTKKVEKEPDKQITEDLKT
ncbi:MAG: hypothetical protein KAX15_03985, partial [Candidatus Omnitrophica bacterium]|nr:hypothetical protein [Candidatus Omnitrophota bacterium]